MLIPGRLGADVAEAGVEQRIISTVVKVNHDRKAAMADRVAKALGGSLQGKRVGVPEYTMTAAVIATKPMFLSKASEMTATATKATAPSTAFRLLDAMAKTPLIKHFRSKPLDGHPTPATPFVRLCTGASGIGIPASFGLAWAAADVYGENAPSMLLILAHQTLDTVVSLRDRLASPMPTDRLAGWPERRLGGQ